MPIVLIGGVMYECAKNKNGERTMKTFKFVTCIISAGLMLGALAGCNEPKPTETSATSSETTLDVIRFTDEPGSTSPVAVAASDGQVVVSDGPVVDSVDPVVDSGEPVIAPKNSVPTSVETPADNSTISYSAEEQEKANIFISNFAEVGFADFNVENKDINQLLNFVHVHYKINARDKIKYENKGGSSYETFKYEDALNTVGRYFGTGLKEDDLKKLPAPSAGGQGPFYEDGRIWYPTADGESYGRVGIVDSAKNNNDGTITLSFTIYTIDWDTYSNMSASDIKKYYKLTPKKADSDKTLTKSSSGTAKVGVGQSGNYFLMVYNIVK